MNAQNDDPKNPSIVNGELHNLENLTAAELAEWIKQTTPNDRSHVIRVLEEAAAILRDELI